MPNQDAYDRLCPEVIVQINGNDLPLEARADLVSVSVKEDTESASMAEFTLVCWDGKDMRVKWIDDDLFKEGNELEVQIGYRGKLARLFHGEITALDVDFPSGGQPTMKIQGLDQNHRLMRENKTQTYNKMKDSEIAEQIASKRGLKTKVEDSKVVIDYVMQSNSSDYEFLKNRANRIGYEIFVKNRTLHFRPRKYEESAVLNLERDIGLLSFSPRLSTVGQKEDVKHQATDPKTKGIFSSNSNRGDIKPMAHASQSGTKSGPSVVKNVFGNTGSTTVKEPVKSQEEADQLSKSANKEAALRYVEGDGECIGQPDLRVGEVVEITGYGDRFSGLYYITSTTHSYSSGGYKTSFHAKRNST